MHTERPKPLFAPVYVIVSATTLANDGFIDDAVPLYLHVRASAMLITDGILSAFAADIRCI